MSDRRYCRKCGEKFEVAGAVYGGEMWCPSCRQEPAHNAGSARQEVYETLRSAGVPEKEADEAGMSAAGKVISSYTDNPRWNRY